MSRALRPSAPIPAELSALRARMLILEQEERERVAAMRRASRERRLGRSLTACGPSDVFLPAHMPDGSLNRIGDASRLQWALTQNGQPVAWFRTQREAAAAAKGASAGERAETHDDMIAETAILLGRIYRIAAARGRARRPECAELEWKLRRLLEGWATPNVIDLVARSRRGDPDRWLERLGAERRPRSTWNPNMPEPEEVF
jgi:hypothetical protein